jgi:hypothetical protein
MGLVKKAKEMVYKYMTYENGTRRNEGKGILGFPFAPLRQEADRLISTRSSLQRRELHV